MVKAACLILGSLAVCSAAPIECCVNAQFYGPTETGTFSLGGLVIQESEPAGTFLYYNMFFTAVPDSGVFLGTDVWNGDGWRVNFDETFTLRGRADTDASGWAQLTLPSFLTHANYCNDCWGGMQVDVSTLPFRANTDDTLMATVRIHGPMDIYQSQFAAVASNLDMYDRGESVGIDFVPDGLGNVSAPTPTPDLGTAVQLGGGLIGLGTMYCRRRIKAKTK